MSHSDYVAVTYSSPVRGFRVQGLGLRAHLCQASEFFIKDLDKSVRYDSCQQLACNVCVCVCVCVCVPRISSEEQRLERCSGERIPLTSIVPSIIIVLLYHSAQLFTSIRVFSD